MRALRVAVRLPLLVLLTIPVVLGTLLARGLDPIWPAGAPRLRDFCSRGFGHGVLLILGGRLHVIGQAPVPPYALVSNHLGYVDVLVYLAALRRPRFVSRADVMRWPLLGPLARLGGTIFLARERVRELPQAFQAIVAALGRGDGVLFFPESTSSGGAGLLPFRPALFEPVASLQIPVRCASLRYVSHDARRPAGESLCWWGAMGFLPHLLQLLAGPGFAAELRFAARPIEGGDRKLLARAAQECVASVFVPTTPAEAAMTDLASAVESNCKLLAEASELLSELDGRAYGPCDAPLQSDGVGAHVRHVLEFYGCLLAGLPSQVVDYDTRPRERALEESPVAARRRIAEIGRELRAIEVDRALRVAHDRGAGESQFWPSSLSRELRFVSSHAVHHFAIVTMLLQLGGHQVASEFGVAPSTLAHRRQLGLAAH